MKSTIVVLGIVSALAAWMGENSRAAVSSRVQVRGVIKNISKDSIELVDARKNVFFVPRPAGAGPELRPGRTAVFRLELSDFVAANRRVR